MSVYSYVVLIATCRELRAKPTTPRRCRRLFLPPLREYWCRPRKRSSFLGRAVIIGSYRPGNTTPMVWVCPRVHLHATALVNYLCSDFDNHIPLGSGFIHRLRSVLLLLSIANAYARPEGCIQDDLRCWCVLYIFLDSLHN